MWSPLVQGRGSKQSLLVDAQVVYEVAPRTGAWIETTTGTPGCASARSPLVQGRGSKRVTQTPLDRNPESPLVQGRGSKPKYRWKDIPDTASPLVQRVRTRFVQKCTLSARAEAARADEVIERLPGHPGDLGDRALRDPEPEGIGGSRPLCRRGRDTPSDPFGPAELFAPWIWPWRVPHACVRRSGRARARRTGANSVVMAFVLDVLFALDTDVLLDRDEGDGLLREGIEDGDDLTQRSAEPGQLGDDQLVARLQDGHQLIEPAAGFGGPSRGGRFDKVVDVEVVLAGVLENGETLAASVLLRGSRPGDRRRFSRSVDGIRFQVFYWTVVDHGSCCFPCQ